MITERRVLRKPELMTRVPLSDATIWRLEKAGKFPKRIRIGGQAVGWFESEINDWLQKKADER
jgi:prophage regulatory protein